MEIKFKIEGKREKKSKRRTNCLKCGLELPRDGSQRKFCNDKCRTRYYSLKQYNLHKEEPSYKRKKKKYHREWRRKKPERFNELMRKASLKYQKKKSQERKKLRRKK